MAFFNKLAKNPRNYNFLLGSYINLFYIPFSTSIKLSYFNICLCKYIHVIHILVFRFKNEKNYFRIVCPTKKKKKNSRRSTILKNMGKFSFNLGKQLFWRLLPKVQGGIKFICPYKSCVSYYS